MKRCVGVPPGNGGGSLSMMVPVAVLPRIATDVFSSTDTVATFVWLAKDVVHAPGAIVFSSTDTLVSVKLSTTRSGLPSPLMSPTATESGVDPAAKLCWVAKVGTVAPGAVLFSSTDTVG